ncbi:MAG: type VI secretion system protein TssA [Methylococcaceae bacterium]|nr:type VI secretion system protein TssA [Methylococcaceae bacterium]
MSDFDLDSFLVALSDDAPCGMDLEYDPAFTALETSALGKPEQQMGGSVKEAEPPNWPAVKKEAIALLGRTRDLRIVKILSEASLQLDRLPGFHACLRLFSGLVEQFWEPVHPRLDPGDDNDPTLRINILNGLCDFDRMIRPLNKVPIVESRAIGAFGLRDFQIASGRIPKPEGSEAASLTEIEAAFKDCDLEGLKATFEAVKGCQEELQKIEQAFTSRLGAQDSPDFSALESVFKEMKQVLSQQIGARTGEGPPLDGDESESLPGSPAGGAAPQRTGAIQSPRDVVRVLDQLCDYYRKQEPSSPIPILLNRARNLVSKDFMEILKDLAPDGVAQIEMFRGKDIE